MKANETKLTAAPAANPMYAAIRKAMSKSDNLGEITSIAEKALKFKVDRGVIFTHVDYFQILQKQLGRVPSDAEVDAWANQPAPVATPVAESAPVERLVTACDCGCIEWLPIYEDDYPIVDHWECASCHAEL